MEQRRLASTEWVDIVNEENEVIAQASREQMLSLIHILMRYALPGIGNNWQVILKSTALVSLLGLEDVVKATQLAGKSTWEPFYFAIVCGVIYLVFTTVSNGEMCIRDRITNSVARLLKMKNCLA